MPYPGVPSNLTGRMEQCVNKVMKEGHDKSSAIAICHKSIVKEAQAARGHRLVDTLVDEDVDEMTTTAGIATVPMGMGKRSDYDSDEVTPKDSKVVDAPTDLGPDRKK